MKTAGILLTGLILTSCMLSAQNQPAPPAPTIRLDVLALDNSGKPVTDLSQSDFQVTDEGKPVKIVYFRAAGVAQAAPQGALSNHTGPALPHVSVILLDMVNQTKMDGLDSAKKIAKSLEELSSGESVYLYMLAMDGSLRPIHGLPEKPGPLSDADKTWNKDAVSLMDAMLKKMPRTMPTGMGNEDKVKKTYVALETLAKQMTAYPCRRNIVWVTDAMPWVTREDVQCPIDWMYCSLYVPHLILNLGRDEAVLSAVSYSTVPPGYARDIEMMANVTGGKRYENTPMQDILAQLATEAGSTYVIAYEPPADNWDQKIHNVRISAKGLKILNTNHRYIALADSRAPAAKQDEVMMSALQSPEDAPDIGMNATVAPVAGNAKAIHLTVKVNPADLLMMPEGDRLVDQMSVAVADYTAHGLKESPTPKSFTIRMTHDQLAKYTKEGLTLAQDHPVDDATQRVRFIVYDHAMNSVGSITVPVTH